MITALILTVLAFQGQESPAFQIEPFPGPRLITYAGVRDDLGMTTSQVYLLINKVSSAFNLVQTSRRPPATEQERTQSMAKILANFTPRQRVRLGELYVQVHQASATLDPKIAAKLRLTRNQRMQIRFLHDQSYLRSRQEAARTH
jgi:hypothetical protein